MIVTIDTNVMYQALQSRKGASFYILQLIRTRKLDFALSIPVFTEYEDVLLRPKSLTHFGMKKGDVDTFLRLIAYLGKPFDIHYRWRPNLKDEADNMLIELAVASRSQWIITNNIRDFTVGNELRYDGIVIGTPAQFVKMWRNNYE